SWSCSISEFQGEGYDLLSAMRLRDERDDEVLQELRAAARAASHLRVKRRDIAPITHAAAITHTGSDGRADAETATDPDDPAVRFRPGDSGDAWRGAGSGLHFQAAGCHLFHPDAARNHLGCLQVQNYQKKNAAADLVPAGGPASATTTRAGKYLSTTSAAATNQSAPPCPAECG